MAELHHIDVANHHFLIERIAGAPIEKTGFTVFLHPGEALLLSGLTQIFTDLLFLYSVEHRSGDFEAERFGSHAQMRFQNLPYIHAAGDT